MKRVYIFLAGIICILLLGGCLDMSDSKEVETEKNNEKDTMNAYEAEHYVSVQEYTGEGFTLRNANPKTGEIAEANRDEVATSVEDYFLTNYKTEVDVKNIVSAVDGVSVFVESVVEPHFYAFAIVPVDVKNEEVKTDEVWSQEGQVENAIQGGLYAMAYEDAFANLDESLKSIIQELPIVDTPIEVIKTVKGTGFSTSQYFISPNGDIFDELYELYLQNPEITKEELINFFTPNNFEPEEMIVTINLHMEEKQVEPTEEVLTKVVSQIEELEGAPRGVYSILIHDNMIDKRRADGMKDTTIKRTTPNKIIKR